MFIARMLLVIVFLLGFLHSPSVAANNANSSQLVAQVQQLANGRTLDKSVFTLALSSDNTATRIEAIQALGRIGGDGVMIFLTPALSDENAQVRRAAAFAIGISGDPAGYDLLWKQLNIEANPTVRQQIYLSLGTIPQADIYTRILIREPKEKNNEVKQAMFQGLAIAMALRSDIQYDLTALYFPHLLMLARQDDELSRQVLAFIRRIPDLSNRLAPRTLLPLTESLKQDANVVALLKVIERLHSSKEVAQLKQWLLGLVRENCDPTSTAECVSPSSLNVRLAAIAALSEFLPDDDVSIALTRQSKSDVAIVRQTALYSRAKATRDAESLYALFQQQLHSDNPEFVIPLFPLLRANKGIENLQWHKDILASQNRFIKIMLARTLAFEDDPTAKQSLLRLQSDEDAEVNKFVHMLTAIDQEQILPFAVMPDFSVIEKAIGVEIILTTTKGKFVLKTLADAPYTAYNFVQLIKNGYYNDSYFDRVIANFVAQGGVNIGYQLGTSGAAIREEISYQSHRPGYVGMATLGKDTGSSHFFINTSDNLYLDQHYTVFAQVIDGYDVVLQLALGDQILSAKVIE